MRLVQWAFWSVVVAGCAGGGGGVAKDDPADDTDLAGDDTDAAGDDTDAAGDDTDAAGDNAAPTVAAPAIEAPNLWNDQLLVATASTQDPDGDSVSLRWVWTNGRTAAQIGSAQQLQLSAALAAPLDTITVEVFADDGRGGVSSASSQVVLANRPPTVEMPVFTPAVVLDNSFVTCRATAYDPDQDALVLQNSWRLNGVPVGGVADQLNMPMQAGDELTCAVTAIDPHPGPNQGRGTSPWVTATVQSSYVPPRFDTDAWTSVGDALFVDCAGGEITVQLRTERWGYDAELYIADTRYAYDYGEQHTMEEVDTSVDPSGYSVFERTLEIGVPFLDQQADVTSVFDCSWFDLNALNAGFAAAVYDANGALADCVVFGNNPDLLLDRGMVGVLGNMPAWMDRASCRNVNP